jgi:hypothetical protein
MATFPEIVATLAPAFVLSVVFEVLAVGLLGTERIRNLIVNCLATCFLRGAIFLLVMIIAFSFLDIWIGPKGCYLAFIIGYFLAAIRWFKKMEPPAK